jgi:hypothetical protein
MDFDVLSTYVSLLADTLIRKIRFKKSISILPGNPALNTNRAARLRLHPGGQRPQIQPAVSRILKNIGFYPCSKLAAQAANTRVEYARLFKPDQNIHAF